MGNCNEVQYSYTATTNTGFSAPLVYPGCATADELETLIWSNIAYTSYVVDYNNPCPLPTFTGTTYVAKITGTTIGATAVYNVSGIGCMSMISGETQSTYDSSPSGSTVDLNSVLTTYVGAGLGSCAVGICSGNTLTPSPQVAYDAIVCGTSESIIVAEVNPFDILDGPLISGNIYPAHVFDVSGYPLTGFCVEIVSAYTENVEFFTATGTTLGNSSITPVAGTNIILTSTGSTCNNCGTDYYLIQGTKTGGCGEGTSENVFAWTTSGLSIGDVFTTTGDTCTDHYCCYTITYVSPSKLNKYFSLNSNVLNVYNDCATCTGDTFQNVTSITPNLVNPGQYNEGEISVTVQLDENVSVNTVISVVVSTTGGTTSPLTETVSVSIPSGSSTGTGTNTLGNSEPGTVIDTCISSTTNPLVNDGAFGCSP
jgi:hypothetical protein